MRTGLAILVLLLASDRAWAQVDQQDQPAGLLVLPEEQEPAVAVKAELRGEVLSGLDAAGVVTWTIPHASLRESGKNPAPVVVVRGNAFYAIHGDLIEANLADGRVVGRTRFPAVIDDLQIAKDGAIDVRMRETMRGGASVDVVHYTPGAPAPGRASLEPAPWLGSRRDAGLLIPGWEAKEFDASKLAPDVRDAALTALAAAAERDPTNAFYRLFEGQLLRAAERKGDARIAFGAASSLPGAPATDLLHVWTQLENLGEPDAAAAAYAAAIDRMAQHGVRADRQRGMLTIVPYVPREALAAAVEARDGERVDAIADKLWQLAPHIEGGRWVWAQLAAWLDDLGQRDRADTWRARAAKGGTTIGAPPEVDLDGWASRSAAFLLAIPIVALLIGLRRGAQARTTPAQLPYFQLVDLAALLLPLIPAIYGRLQVVDGVAAIGRGAGAPMALWSDAVDNESVTWVDRELPESDAKTEIATYLRAELDAMRAGGRSDAAPFDLERTLPAAIAAKDPMGTRLRRIDEGVDELQGEQLVPTMSVPGALGLGLVLFAIGFAVAKRKPGVQVLARIVPGGAGPLWALGGLIAGAFLAGIYHFAWDPWLGELAYPSYDRMFGLEQLPDLHAPARVTPWWPFAAIGGAVAAQAAAAWLELRRR